MRFLPLTFSAITQYYAKSNNTTVGGYYPTEKHPTTSAVIGLIGAALGCPRGDQTLYDLKQTLIIKYKRVSENAKILHEFQTALKKGDMVPKISGQTEPVKGSIIKRIDYLQDAEFQVFVGCGDEQLLQRIHAALQNPVYALYFGKRVCVPNKPIVNSEFQLVEEEELSDVYNCS